MLKFGTDLDDCILDTASLILKFLGKPSEKIYNSISRYSIEKCLNIPLNIVEKAIDKALGIKNIPYLEDVEEYLPKVYEIVDCFSVITLRRLIHTDNIVNSIQNIIGKNKFDLFLCKHTQSGIPNKSEIIQDLNLDIFVEDRYATALDIVENTECKVFLFDKPWNRGRKHHENITRIYSWKEIYDKLSEMEN